MWFKVLRGKTYFKNNLDNMTHHHLKLTMAYEIHTILSDLTKHGP